MGEGQANGLSFSVNKNIKIPPSLNNIFIELKNNYPNYRYSNGDLSRWAKQGVLLLNSILTVRKSQPGSHRKIDGKGLLIMLLKLYHLKKRILYFSCGEVLLNLKLILLTKGNI